MPPSDRELMLRVQAGEHNLFAQLVDRFRPRLLRFATNKLGDRTTAEDVVQETFLAVFVSRASYDSRFALSTWIWTILLNACRKAHAKRSRPLVASTASPATSPASAEAELSEHREELHAWLAHLPEVEADALRLRFFGELSFEEIAAAMNSSVSGAKVRVRRGLERLAELARERRVETVRNPDPVPGSGT